jgi:hypothetical protein
MDGKANNHEIHGQHPPSTGAIQTNQDNEQMGSIRF